MAETSAPLPATGMPTASKALCTAYAAISVAAFVAYWSQGVAYFDRPASFVSALLDDTKITPASRAVTVEVLFIFLAAAVLMVLEARKHRIGFVWLYILGGAVVAISVTFPLFLIAREYRLAKTAPSRLGMADTLALAALASATAALAIWVDAG